MCFLQLPVVFSACVVDLTSHWIVEVVHSAFGRAGAGANHLFEFTPLGGCRTRTSAPHFRTNIVHLFEFAHFGGCRTRTSHLCGAPIFAPIFCHLFEFAPLLGGCTRTSAVPPFSHQNCAILHLWGDVGVRVSGGCCTSAMPPFLHQYFATFSSLYHSHSAVPPFVINMFSSHLLEFAPLGG